MTEDKIQNTNPYMLAWHITPQGRSQKIHNSEEKNLHYFLWKVMGIALLGFLFYLYVLS